MKRYIVGMLILVVAMVISGTAALAAPGDGERPDGEGPGHPPRGAGGEVIEISDMSLTVMNRMSETVAINLDEETVVFFVETQTEGSLDEVVVGDKVRAHGERNEEDGSVEADRIMVAPRGDMAGGKITAVDGAVITVENREGEVSTIITTESTEFRNGEEAATLEDVAVDGFLRAFGEQAEDGSLTATLVMLNDGPPRRPDGPPCDKDNEDGERPERPRRGPRGDERPAPSADR